MSLGGGGGQMEEIQQQIQAMNAEVESIENEIDELRGEQADIDEATEAIDVLDDGSTVQVPLGGDAYVRATIEDMDEIIVSLGGGYAAEHESDDAVDTLERKRDSIDDRIETLQGEVSEIETQVEELEQQAQQMQQQQMQQMQQQMGGLGGGDGDEE